MKLGTIASLWRYDAEARHPLQSARARRPAIFYYASFTGFKWITGHVAGFDSRADVILCSLAPSSSSARSMDAHP
jgi:hypothetical protein